MTGAGGARGLSFPAGRGGGSIMKASGTVSEGWDETGRDRTGLRPRLRPSLRGPLGGRRCGLAALESGLCAPKRPCLAREGGERPTWRRRRSRRDPRGGHGGRTSGRLGRSAWAGGLSPSSPWAGLLSPQSSHVERGGRSVAGRGQAGAGVAPWRLGRRRG